LTPDNRTAILEGMPKPKTKLRDQQTEPELPTVSCTLCPAQLPHRPGQAANVLTKHYNDRHLDELTGAETASR
jgi:hypothetical protein